MSMGRASKVLSVKTLWMGGRVVRESKQCSIFSCKFIILFLPMCTKYIIKGLDIYYRREMHGSKCWKFQKFFVDPQARVNFFSQTPAKNPIIFTDPLQFHRFYALSTGQHWGHLVIFHRPPYWIAKLFVHPLHTSDNFCRPPYLRPIPPLIVNVKSLSDM